MYCGALERHAHVLPHECPGLRQRFHAAIDVHAAVGQLTRTLARVHEQRADAAVDVDPGVTLGGPGRIRERVEPVLVFAEVPGQCLQQRRALVERELA